MKRRIYEHLGYYKKDLSICWISPRFSKYTTLRVEDNNKILYKNNPQWEYMKNDRFIVPMDTKEVVVKVRKEYHIKLVKYSGE